MESRLFERDLGPQRVMCLDKRLNKNHFSVFYIESYRIEITCERLCDHMMKKLALFNTLSFHSCRFSARRVVLAFLS